MSASKYWTFTINSPTESDEEVLQTIDVRFIIWQYEQTTNLHIQGYVQLNRAVTLKTVKKKINERAHFEIAKGTAEQNIEYCTKLETRVRPGGRRGEPIGQGQRRDIEAFVKLVRDTTTDNQLIEQHPLPFLKYCRAIDRIRNAYITPRDWEMQNVVYWGQSGTGKTRRAHQEAGADCYFVSKGDSNQHTWFDGYMGQNSVILDDFYGWLPWNFILRILDRYPFAVQYKGGSRQFTSRSIFITSNVPPEKWYKNIPNDDITPLMRRLNKIEEMN